MKLTWMGHQLLSDGYGLATIKIGQALGRLGVEVTEIDMMVLGGRFSRPGEVIWEVDGPAVALTAPDWWPDIHARPLTGFTMFEATRLPEKRVEWINEWSQKCLVPCEWNEQVFRACGVTVPIHLVPLGVDPDDYYPADVLPRDADGVFRFLWSGTPDARKGWDLVYQAFIAAFGKRTDVSLTMHFREMPRGMIGSSDPNVKLVCGRYGLQALRRMYWRHDCYVFPSRGEGWGLPPREAAASGLPVIATDAGGLAVGGDAWKLPLRSTGLVKAQFGGWDLGEVGEWFEPDFDHLVELMRWCAANRFEAREMGLRAAYWLARNQTWEDSARAVLEALRC